MDGNMINLLKMAKKSEMTNYRASKTKYSTALLLLLLFQFQAVTKQVNYGTVIVSEVTSIYDGDTFRANINGWHELIGKNVSIRVNGIDTPEIRTKCDKENNLLERQNNTLLQCFVKARLSLSAI